VAGVPPTATVSLAAIPTAEEPAPEPAQTTTPAEASPVSGGSGDADGALTSAHIDAEWDAAMRQVYETMRKAGRPVTETLRAALRAKAARVDEAARQQGAELAFKSRNAGSR
jgi:hypothetical protein